MQIKLTEGVSMEQVLVLKHLVFGLVIRCVSPRYMGVFLL